ncbi:MAG TPA: efflux RND transporter periplasmic adaptor subunit [Candidatus Binatia bacterium]|nr:efflux RND transporter periplasmic adaptor subunit [Candidatus Binatia bacterium]
MTPRTLFRPCGGLLLFLAGMLAGCSPPAPPVADTAPPQVSVSLPVVDPNMVDQDEYEGRITAAQNVDIRARVRGHLVKINFNAGDKVKKGDPLYEIDPEPYQAALDGAEAQLKAAKASLEFAKAEYARTRLLVGKGGASREELDVWSAKQLTADSDVAKAQAAVDQAKLNLKYAKVVAPLEGKMSRTLVDVGNLVNAGGGETLLTNLVTVDPMYVSFFVDERSWLRYLRLYRKDKEADGTEQTLRDLHIPVSVGLEGEEGYPHKGEIFFADNKVNPNTGTKEVRGELDNKKRLFEDGMRARVRIPIGDPHKVIKITERAIGTDQGLKFVYVVNDQNVVERKDVTLDREVDGLQIISGGLKPEDRVIVSGIQRVREGLKVEPKLVPMPGAKQPDAAAEKIAEK